MMSKFVVSTKLTLSQQQQGACLAQPSVLAQNIPLIQGHVVWLMMCGKAAFKSTPVRANVHAFIASVHLSEWAVRVVVSRRSRRRRRGGFVGAEVGGGRATPLLTPGRGRQPAAGAHPQGARLFSRVLVFRARPRHVSLASRPLSPSIFLGLLPSMLNELSGSSNLNSKLRVYCIQTTNRVFPTLRLSAPEPSSFWGRRRTRVLVISIIDLGPASDSALVSRVVSAQGVCVCVNNILVLLLCRPFLTDVYS